MSVQCAAAASQKLTCPVFNCIEPDITVAVRVTTVPCETDVTALPALVTVIVAVVAELAKTGQLAASIDTKTKISTQRGREPKQSQNKGQFRNNERIRLMASSQMVVAGLYRNSKNYQKKFLSKLAFVFFGFTASNRF
jgi:hypothetical protein